MSDITALQNLSDEILNLRGLPLCPPGLQDVEHYSTTVKQAISNATDTVNEVIIYINEIETKISDLRQCLKSIIQSNQEAIKKCFDDLSAEPIANDIKRGPVNRTVVPNEQNVQNPLTKSEFSHVLKLPAISNYNEHDRNLEMLEKAHKLQKSTQEVMNSRLNDLINETETKCAMLKKGVGLTETEIKQLQGCLASWKTVKSETSAAEKRKKLTEAKRRKQEEKQYSEKETTERRIKKQDGRKRKNDKDEGKRKKKDEEDRLKRQKEEEDRKEAEEKKAREEEKRKQKEEELKLEKERLMCEQKERTEREKMRLEEEAAMMVEEKRKRLEAERREKEVQKQENEKRAWRQDPNNWETLVYDRPCDEVDGKREYHGGISCIVSSPPGGIERDSISCCGHDEEDSIIETLAIDEIPDAVEKLIGFEVNNFTDIKAVVVNRPCCQRITVDKPGVSVQSSMDRNVQLFVPRDAFLSRTELQFGVHKVSKENLHSSAMEDADLENVNVRSFITVKAEKPPGKKVELDIFNPTNKQGSDKHQHRKTFYLMCTTKDNNWRFADVEYKGHREDLTLILPPGRETYTIMELEAPSACPTERLPDLAEIMYKYINKTVVRMIVKQHQENPEMCAVRIVRREQCKEILKFLTESGYTEGPDTSAEFSVSEGQHLQILCEGNIQIANETNPEHQLTYLSYMGGAGMTIDLRVKNTWIQKDLSAYVGIIKCFIQQSATSASSVELIITLPKPLKKRTVIAFAKVRFPYYCDAGRAESEGNETGSWLLGRRLVELQVLGKGLEACVNCVNSLHLKDIIRETLQGLGSILHIKCRNCLMENIVPTGKRHAGPDGNGLARIFDVNTKLAAVTSLANLLSHQLSEDDPCSWQDVLRTLLGKSGFNAGYRKAKRKVAETDVAICRIMLLDWMKALPVNEDKLLRITEALQLNGHWVLAESCVEHVRFQKEHLSDVSLRRLATGLSKDVQTLGQELGLNRSKIDICIKENLNDIKQQYVSVLEEWRESEDIIMYGEKAVEHLQEICLRN